MTLRRCWRRRRCLLSIKSYGKTALYSLLAAVVVVVVLFFVLFKWHARLPESVCVRELSGRVCGVCECRRAAKCATRVSEMKREWSECVEWEGEGEGGGEHMFVHAPKIKLTTLQVLAPWLMQRNNTRTHTHTQMLTYTTAHTSRFIL